MVTEKATLRAKEAASYLGVSYWLLLDMVRRKQIPCIKAGNRLLFRMETLNRWLENAEMTSVHQEEAGSDKGFRRIEE